MTGTWNSTGANDPVPNTIVSIATSAGSSGSTGQPLQQTADDGYKDPTGTANSSGTHYLLETQSPFTITVSPTASVSATATDSVTAMAGVTLGGITMTTCVPTLALGGTISDSSGNLNILVGQHCAPSLSGINGCVVDNSSYHWAVSGTTFQDWTVSADQSYAIEDDGPGPLTNPNINWYWNETSNATETVSCTATVIPPAGQGNPFPITLTQKVMVYVPVWSCTGTGGAMQVNTALNGANGNYFLYAGPADTSTPGRGMEWKATLSPLPAPFSGTGALELVQTETPSLTYTSSMGVVYNRSNNGQQGLDTSYDYGWDQPSTAPTYTAGDSPNISLTGVASAQLNSSFVDTLMYEPPGSSQYVSLATFKWSTNGNAQLPGTKNWQDYGSGSAGTLTPTGANNFTSSITYPSWSQNVGVGWTWVAAK